MSTLHTRFEIFISYAHKDNVPVAAQSIGWVTALRDQILADQRQLSTEPLVIFFDTDDIRDMDDWEHRILGALRYSRILLVCLSPKLGPRRMPWKVSGPGDVARLRETALPRGRGQRGGRPADETDSGRSQWVELQRQDR